MSALESGLMAAGFNRALADAGITGTAHSVGPVAQVSLGVEKVATFSDFLAADWETYNTMLVELLRRHQVTLPGGRWYPSAAHTEAQIDQTVAAFADALAATYKAR